MKIGFVSDTHNHRSKDWGLEPCDIIVHSGDFSFRGEFAEIQKFLVDAETAMKRCGAREFIVVPGNHEVGVEQSPDLFKEWCKERGITCLIHESVEIEGIKFFGTPWQPEFCNWAYNVWDSHELSEKYDEIPDDTDVLITHCPPMNILDFTPNAGHVGSPELSMRVQQLLGKIKIHAFGHIHYSAGVKEFMGTTFVNAAILSDLYSLNPKEKRMVVLEYETLRNKTQQD